jgi:hypothetical protein
VSASLRRMATLVAAVVACALPAGSAQAAPPRDNTATAIATVDGSFVHDFAWDVHRERDVDLVDDRNSATAHASCVACHATAIAFQIVIVTGSPRVVVPANTAEAVNVGCTDCQSVAEARQFVRVVPAPVRFTWRGLLILADVRRDLRRLAAQDLSAVQIHLAVEEQEARVKDVLANELVLRSDPDTDADVVEQRTLQSADAA